MRPKLGELLVQAGVIDQMQLRAALAEQRKWGGRLGNILVEMRMLSEDELVSALSRQLNIPRFKFSEGTVAEAALSLIKVETCEKYSLLPVAVNTERRVLLVAMSDPTNYEVVDELQFTSGHRVQVAVSGQSELFSAIRQYHYGDPSQFGGGQFDDGSGSGVGPMTFSNYGDFSGENLIEEGRSQPVQNYQPQPEAEPEPLPAGQVIGEAAEDDRFAMLEERIRRVMTAQKEMINLLIEKGVLGKAELMARLKKVHKK